MKRYAAYAVTFLVAAACGGSSDAGLFGPDRDGGSTGGGSSGGSPAGGSGAAGSSVGGSSGGSSSGGAAGTGTSGKGGAPGAGGTTTGGQGGTSPAGAGGTDAGGAGGATGGGSGSGGKGGSGTGGSAGTGTGGSAGTGTGGSAGTGTGGSGSGGGGSGGTGGVVNTSRKVKCGSTSCTLGQQFCCASYGSNGSVVEMVCRNNGQSCQYSNSPPTFRSDNRCDESSDCAGSRVCCGDFQTNPFDRYRTIACQEKCEGDFFVQLCDPADNDCRSGVDCISDPDMPGYYYCDEFSNPN